MTPLPRDFAYYDLNDDGKISLGEFCTTLNEDIDNDKVQEAFELADDDGKKNSTQHGPLRQSVLSTIQISDIEIVIRYL